MTLDTRGPLTRRRFIKLALGGAALLAGAGGLLHGLSPNPQLAQGYRVLREADVHFLGALIPVILAGAASPEQLKQRTEVVLQSLDQGLAHFSPAATSLLQELFDACTNPVTRGALTGIWQPWQDASGEQIDAFLQRWRDSSLGLLRQGYAALVQAILLAWYDNPASWQHCGYPGPPAPFQGAV